MTEYKFKKKNKKKTKNKCVALQKNDDFHSCEGFLWLRSVRSI